MLNSLTRVLKSAKNRFINWRYGPAIEVEPCDGLVRLGTVYGGWTVLDAPNLQGCVAISCGFGEDASFDVEFANRYGATVVVVDPTPRAVAHFEQIVDRIAVPCADSFGPGGSNSTEPYSLSALTEHSLALVDKALWSEETILRFYPPANERHVSHSAVRPDDRAGAEQTFIEVEATTYPLLAAQYEADRVALLKMDIEGAEGPVLEAISSWPSLPSQLLVEYDMLGDMSATNVASTERIDAILRSEGYVCRHFDGLRNYLYVLIASTQVRAA